MLLLVSNVLLIPAAYAQVDAGDIRGTVTDSSGALVSGAKVTLASEGSGLSTEATTARDGNYAFTPIKIGSYTLVVEAAGFRKATQQGIKVDVQRRFQSRTRFGTRTSFRHRCGFSFADARRLGRRSR
jgi:hypothetical protein